MSSSNDCRVNPISIAGWTADDVELQLQELHESELSDGAVLIILRLVRYVQELNDRVSDLEYTIKMHNL